jgi:hypothetical protein
MLKGDGSWVGDARSRLKLKKIRLDSALPAFGEVLTSHTLETAPSEGAQGSSRETLVQACQSLA